ncbi:flavodoxin family protein [Thermodesulfobacteriota bacterium]
MKVLGVCLSQRKGGNSEILLEEALKGSNECGDQTEILSLSNKRLEPCNGCFECKTDRLCPIKDDMLTIYPKLIDADAIIFATPVYFWSLPGIGKIFLDRTYALRSPELKLMNKVGAAITVASSSGNISALQTLNMFFLTNHMITADYVAGYAYNKEIIRKHKHAMLGAYELGRLVSSIMANGFQYPREFNRPIYLLVKEKYGIHMSPFENEFEG